MSVNALVEKGILAEQKCGSNFAYTLLEDGLFLPTEYKVLRSQDDQCFLKCMKLTYNGQIQFYYLLEDYRSLAQMLPSLDADGLMVIVTNVLANMLQVKNNGFLSCQKLDLTFEHIYVDTNTYKVKLVYVPVNQGFYMDDASCENAFRTSLIKLIGTTQNLCNNKTIKFANSLSNALLSLQDLYETVNTGEAFQPYGNTGVINAKTYPGMQPKTEGRRRSASSMQLVSLNAPNKIALAVDRSEYVIGKKADAVDGVLSFNKMISRIHCKIIQKDGQFFIEDLQSANGTYVNYEKLNPHSPRLLKNGDRIRLANSDFEAMID